MVLVDENPCHTAINDNGTLCSECYATAVMFKRIPNTGN
jgi:hypothetical protein